MAEKLTDADKLKIVAGQFDSSAHGGERTTALDYFLKQLEKHGISLKDLVEGYFNSQNHADLLNKVEELSTAVTEWESAFTTQDEALKALEAELAQYKNQPLSDKLAKLFKAFAQAKPAMSPSFAPPGENARLRHELWLAQQTIGLRDAEIASLEALLESVGTGGSTKPPHQTHYYPSSPVGDLGGKCDF